MEYTLQTLAPNLSCSGKLGGCGVPQVSLCEKSVFSDSHTPTGGMGGLQGCQPYIDIEIRGPQEL